MSQFLECLLDLISLGMNYKSFCGSRYCSNIINFSVFVCDSYVHPDLWLEPNCVQPQMGLYS
jgi:hypothetical protein